MAATTTTTMAAMDATTTTMAATSGGGDTGGATGSTDGKTTGGTTGGDTGSTDGKTSTGGSTGGDATTTTTTTAASTTTTLGQQKFNAKVKLAVSDTKSFLADMTKAKATMADAIVASNDQVTSTDMVMINSITEVTAGGRRLGELSRRLNAGELEVDYTITFPVAYSGPGITEANTDFTKMVDSIKNNKHGITVEVTSTPVFTMKPSCTGSSCGVTTTAKATTTAATQETGGAVSAKQLASSVAAVLLVKLLSGL